MIRINNIKMNLDYTDKQLNSKVCRLLKVNNVSKISLVKKSIDCRDKGNVIYILSVDVQVPSGIESKIIKNVHNNNIMLTKDINYTFPYVAKESNGLRPVIIGAGPAGYFAALKLAEAGFKPALYERGKSVEDRTRDVNDFWNNNEINCNSNVSFGEGGAGTFSDGKLNTGIKDKSGRIGDVLNQFVRFGADESILYNAKPHIGTDVLCKIMKNMREHIITLGGEVNFSKCLKDIEVLNSDIPLYKLTISDTDTDEISYTETNSLIIAIGHSARDTFQMIFDRGFEMEQKPFAIGLRIEHPQDMINTERYGAFKDKLPAADYKLTYHSESGRSVFSFCMCPGGYVVNASSGRFQSVVNGMSYSGRDSRNANSAIVCSVTPEDFPGDMPLDAVKYQEELEKRFYEAGKTYIPVQTFGDFEENVPTANLGEVEPAIKGKYTLTNLRECLPDYVSSAIIEGVHAFNKQINGFDRKDAVLSGIESRTSSPVRIIRDNDMMSNYKGIIPAGEGAGYAGGITSAAVDGIKAAEAVAKYIENL